MLIRVLFTLDFADASFMGAHSKVLAGLDSLFPSFVTSRLDTARAYLLTYFFGLSHIPPFSMVVESKGFFGCGGKEGGDVVCLSFSIG